MRTGGRNKTFVITDVKFKAISALVWLELLIEFESTHILLRLKVEAIEYHSSKQETVSAPETV